MLRASWKVAPPLKKCLCGKSQLHPLRQCRGYTTGSRAGTSAGKIVGGSILFIGGGLGGTILYAKWDPRFRENIEKTVPYSEKVFELALGPAPYNLPLLKKQDMEDPLKVLTSSEISKESKLPKSMQDKEASPFEATIEDSSKHAAAIISAVGDAPTVPAPVVQGEPSIIPQEHGPETTCEHEMKQKPDPSGESCSCENEALQGQHIAVEERPPQEVAKHLAQQDREENVKVVEITSTLEDALGRSAQVTLKAIEAQDSAIEAITSHAQRLKEAMDNSENTADRKSEQWRALETALSIRSKVVNRANEALMKAKEELDNLRSTIEEAKQSQISSVRPQLLAAEENLHHMLVDLDHVERKVQAAQSEAKIVVQYSELVAMARDEFKKELESITPDVKPGWKNLKVSDLAGQLSTDDLNSLIAHAHRRIDQLNRELAEQQVREQQHIDMALEHQKLEHKKALETAVTKALEHYRSEILLERDKKAEEVREVMEAEMRTQLRRQAAAHTDHLREVLKVQEQEFKGKYQEELQQKISEYEIEFRRLAQEQVDNFTLDMNAAYSRLKGIEQAMESHAIAEEEARKAHQLWLSIEALQYTLKTSSGDSLTEPLQKALEAITNSCGDDQFTQALVKALPQECLSRGVYSEEALRHRFYTVRKIARRVAMIDETRNSLYQYFLSYLQSFLLMEPQVAKPPEELNPEDLDTFRLLSYASFCVEHGDLELAAKFVNQLRGEPRRVARDWLTEARVTLETKQIVEILSAYANAVGLGTTQVQ
ncbi:MICOS complex subunit MIC60 isoform X1 [Carcharodon carcharias]|uniref:MICOS complex subunit MIC60 isoform X1 n=1 Tax=Carcharodon carcharias TaxID=13397 RepID=UPI001B7E5AE1|nr:MICOS complex subunit MIC60 isoform X1 [Carcharodon carcharias]